MSTSRSEGLTLSQAAVVTGLAYLLNPVPFAEFLIYPKVVVAGNIQQTVSNIGAHHGLFLTALFCYIVNFAEDIVIAWALYFLLAPVNKALSLLAALFRLMYTAVALAGAFNLVTVYRMVTDPEYLATFGAAQFNAQINLLLHTFRYDYSFAICVIFSIHLLLTGWLIFRSRYMPWWLGIIIVVNGLAWLISNLKPYLYPAANLGPIGLAYFGELLMMAWLLIWGWRIKEPVSAAP